ncbi:MAG TPA: bifunctional oligoribonuclease/PAP phosphatase NrnA [Crocinitomicaceae bacterium]|nr:bifunctional oligoribonuclease/PAP phosphatase NrnA [Crocinitomicaceae bacterium]
MINAKQIVAAIQTANNIVITSHRSPDGDSIGSSMGMYHFVKALGKDAKICHPDKCPDFIEWAKDDVRIATFEEDEQEVKEALKDADLIFCLDYNGANRLGKEMGPFLEQAKGMKVMIDHHLDPDNFVDIAVSQPDVCSTSQLVYELIEASGSIELLDKRMGSPLYLGIMTDTGSFRYSSVTARTHEVLASLLKHGVKQAEVHEATFDNNRIDKIKLRAHILAERLEVIEELHVAIVSVTEEELERFNHIKGDTEGLVNVALSMEGVDAAVFFRESGDMVKISFRSKGDIAVNVLAGDHFNGGGHKNASGGASFVNLDETIKKFKEVAPNYFK